MQAFPIAGGAQAKVEDMSRALLTTVSQIPGKSFFQQVTSGSSQPFADIGKKLAVSTTHFCVSSVILLTLPAAVLKQLNRVYGQLHLLNYLM